ncbi:MAG: histidinol-phosphate transaminase [Proteobacteria bacterium]|nr:histidinol-phosphate transaminase [Pseudomonadota bacterium]
MSLLDRVPRYVRELIPYPPGKPIEEVEREYGIADSVKLASNECPIGPSPKGVEAARKALSKLNIYPDGSGYYLKKHLSEKLGMSDENFILGNGSNEIIELIIRTFIKEGDEAVMGDPAFVVYQLITKGAGGKALAVPLLDYTHDLKAMAAAVTERTKIVFVANPNNPTGTIVDRKEMETFFEAVPDDVLMVFDEAYFEYASGSDEYQDAMAYIESRPNVIVLRTFSKAYGLAGLRVGYGIASPGLISMLERVRQPFNVNSPALAAAVAALDDEEHLNRALEVNREGMAWLEGELEKAGFEVVKSFANFILFDARMNAAELYEALLRKGVIVRPMGAYGMEEHIRVTVGLPEENTRFIEALNQAAA